jgi:hypothetical protein
VRFGRSFSEIGIEFARKVAAKEMPRTTTHPARKIQFERIKREITSSKFTGRSTPFV